MDTRERWRRAPAVTFHELAGDGPILVLAPHPDDETIGCGGLIQQAVRAGVAVFIDVLTDGSRSHPNSRSHGRAELAALRRAEAKAAVRRLGINATALRFWPEEDSRLPASGAAADALAERLRHRLGETRARVVFVTWADDPHCDHKAAFALAEQSLTGLEHPPRLYAYPVWSWTVEAMPANPREGRVVRLDIAGELEGKREALSCHASQLGRVIRDDPVGFSLAERDLALFLQPFETFIAVTPGV